MNKLLVMLLLVSNCSFAATKWIDEKGQTHYTDQLPPTSVRAQSVKGSKDMAPVAASSAVEETKTVPLAPQEQARIKQEAADKLALEASQKKVKTANCTSSQQNLANLKDGMRVATIDPKTGERSYMEDDERAAKVSQYQQDIKKYCD
ncbi:MAG: DUF4124 domain-containing protein [Gallionella sp.]